LTLAPGAVLPGELEITYRCSIRDDGVWDLWAKFQGKTVWKLLVDMSPPELVRCLDFRYVTDALTPDEATSLLDANAPTRAERERQMREFGFPAYTTSSGLNQSGPRPS
jgi:L-fuconate dehydratase